MTEKEQLNEMETMDEREYTSEMESVDEGNRVERAKEVTVKKKGRLIGSTAFKITVYFIMSISLIMAVGGLIGSLVLYEQGAYTQRYEEFLQNAMKWTAYDDADWIFSCFSHDNGEMPGYIRDYFADGNVGYRLLLEEKEVDSSNVMENARFPYRFYFTYYDDFSNVGKEAVVEMFVDFSEEPEYDKYWNVKTFFGTMYSYRFTIPIITFISILIFLISAIILLCASGHKKYVDGIAPSILTPIPFDVLTVGFVAIESVFIAMASEFVGYGSWRGAILAFTVLIGTVLILMPYFMEFALRLKRGGLLKDTLIYKILHGCVRFLRWCFRKLKKLILGIPLIWISVTVFLVVSFFELFGILVLQYDTGILLFVWFIEKVVMFLALAYVALQCKKLQLQSGALADGNLSSKVDTDKMFFAMKEHGENLNRIGEGMVKAVEERMRSERLKTELITNVSHDLKTPLTSIINYADLLGSESLAPEQVSEYAEVLMRQSKRLKTLLENLVEASKATTGNLEVNLQNCEVGVLLTQAAGEYEHRFEQRQLSMIVKQPEEPVYIWADGRHLWRVFDNLLNNICKYAQENSRVYLSLEVKGEEAVIIFRNMSKYPLELSGEDFEERFVRGDKSRHMEGNGLGLSIAKSLVELQHGKMRVKTDGDLFKVVLCFPIHQDKEEAK